jgi:hypothetical protein
VEGDAFESLEAFQVELNVQVAEEEAFRGNSRIS